MLNLLAVFALGVAIGPMIVPPLYRYYRHGAWRVEVPEFFAEVREYWKVRFATLAKAHDLPKDEPPKP